MLKYDSTLVTFTEVPDEISLCFNISNCPCHCQDCFEPWLREDRGDPLTLKAVCSELEKHPHVTCVCWMGGDSDYDALIRLSTALTFTMPSLKIAMYSGRPEMSFPLADYLNYYKVGPYMPQYGPLNKTTTNQRFYKKVNDSWVDITYRFQEKKD